MKVLVCVKVSKGEINPFDESALECALSLSDDVSVISLGPASAGNALIPLTRLGAKVTLISDSLYAGSDTLATSYILSEAIRKTDFDLILCGRQSTDGDTAQVGPMLSTFLKLPVVTNAVEIKKDGSFLTAKTRTGEEKIPLPGVVTVERSYTLRFPSIFSKASEIEIKDNTYLNCDISRCGLYGSPTRVMETYENQRGKRKCKFIRYKELLPLISELKEKKQAKNESRIISEKLDTVWAVGEDVYKIAENLATHVVLKEKLTPEEIANKARDEKPDAILFPSDLWGRKTAPQIAALLNTGLCADCTELDVSDGRLIMYRPAGGNSIYAKIKCITNPQMATVRTKSESSDIIVSGGRGIKDKTDKLKALAKSIGAQTGSSRALTDTGAMPYDSQIGLTGKTVAPSIYIAIGISGAVQHTCAIEGATTVIAINPDKDARIFEYADYGIIEEF